MTAIGPLHILEYFAAPDRDHIVRHAWERLLDGGAVAPHELRPPILDSWRRCIEHGVDPAMFPAPAHAEKTELSRSERDREDLLRLSDPLLKGIHEFLPKGNEVLLLADSEGTILQIQGYPYAVESANEAGMVIGTNWSEPACGTNAVGTSLFLRHPLQIHGEEHFCEALKRWTCSASPILHPVSGDLVGMVDISAPRQSYEQHHLALAVSCARLVENGLKKSLTEMRLRLLAECANFTGHQQKDGVLIVDRFGYLLNCSQKGLHALNRIRSTDALDTDSRVIDPELLARPHDPAQTPGWLRMARIEPVQKQGEILGYLIILPAIPTRVAPAHQPSESRTKARLAFEHIAGTSKQLRQSVERASSLAASSAPVMILGETGVGKDVFANAIHRASERADGPFIAINCGSISRELLASELFGYAAGAFTGARKEGSIGKIEAANNGTLFLDEIGELPLEIQPSLLRVLENGEIFRLGENRPRKVNFRLITATHRDLQQDIVAGRFRMDIYYRIAVTSVTIPPLRQRPEDIPALLAEWLKRTCQRYGKNDLHFDDDVHEILLAYHWPGNVRELRNVVESAVIVAAGERITTADLPVHLLAATLAKQDSARYPTAVMLEAVSLEAAEAELLRSALASSEGNMTKAANLLGIAKSTAYQKIRKHNLTGELKKIREII